MKTLSLLNNKRFHVIALVILVCAVFGNTMLNEYSLDDNLDIYENKAVLKGVAGIPEIFRHPFVQLEYLQFDYRPIAPVTYALEYQLFGLNPHVSHFINILLYIVGVLLSYYLLSLILRGYKPYIPFIIAVIFTVHPLHTEVVASLKNRQELLSYIFGMCALTGTFHFLHNDTGRIKNVLIILVAITLALFSKLASLPFIAIIIFMFFYYREKQLKLQKILISFLLICIPAIFIFCTRKWLFRTFTFDENPLVYYSSLSYKIGTTLKVFLYYVKLLFIPYPLSFYYGYNQLEVANILSPVAVVSMILFICLFMISVRWIIKKDIKGIMMMFFLVALSMYNNITFTYPGLLSDRAMFMPGLWFISAIVLLINDVVPQSRKTIKRYASITLIFIVLIFSVYSVKRNAQWKTQLSIMEADISHLQNSSLANFFYAWTLQTDFFNTGNAVSNEKAQYYYLQAIKINPNMPEPYYRLGRYKRETANDLDSAHYYFSEFIKLDSIHSKGYYELGLTEFYQQKYSESYANFQKVYNKMPGDTLTLFYMVQSLYMLKGAEEALKLNDKLMKLAPGTQYPYLNAGSILKATSNEKDAYAYLGKAVKLGCNNPALIKDIIDFYKMQNDLNKVDEYKKYLSSH